MKNTRNCCERLFRKCGGKKKKKIIEYEYFIEEKKLLNFNICLNTRNKLFTVHKYLFNIKKIVKLVLILYININIYLHLINISLQAFKEIFITI
jgi:hypothetical protein